MVELSKSSPMLLLAILLTVQPWNREEHTRGGLLSHGTMTTLAGGHPQANVKQKQCEHLLCCVNVAIERKMELRQRKCKFRLC